MEFILASHNKNKIEEIRSIMPPELIIHNLFELGYKEEIIEDGDTLEENAAIKARTIAQKFSKPCIADDTGLEVEALDGRPGVYSARYAGIPPDASRNITKLLDEMNGMENRKARFRTLICLNDGRGEHFFEGIVNGTIAHEPKGRKGFGYDPVFIPAGYQNSFAQLDTDEKNRISHRARALSRLKEYLEQNG